MVRHVDQISGFYDDSHLGNSVKIIGSNEHKLVNQEMKKP